MSLLQPAFEQNFHELLCTVSDNHMLSFGNETAFRMTGEGEFISLSWNNNGIITMAKMTRDLSRTCHFHQTDA